MLVTWRGMFLVRHSLYSPSLRSDSTNIDSSRFFVKLIFSCEIYLELHECLVFRFNLYIFFFHKRRFFSRICQKKKNNNNNSFCFDCALRPLNYCNVYCGHSSVLSILFIPGQSLSEMFVFQYMQLCHVGTKYLILLQLFFLYPSAKLASNYGIISSYRDSTGSLFCC